ncbi:MAG: DUF2461 domain-containing protein [Arachnia sp.]
MTVEFEGFAPEAFEFYRELIADNSREFWLANKPRYERLVKEPMALLVDALEDEFGVAKLFRPNRDVRFSADKSPYKTHQGAYVPAGPAMGWYVQVSADGVMTGGGFYAAERGALAGFRAAVNEHGDELREILDDLVAEEWEVGGDQLKTAPRGYPPDHPQIGLLRHKTLTIGRDYAPSQESVGSAELLDVVRDDWRSLTPLVRWLSRALADTAG